MSDFILGILRQIEDSIRQGIFKDVERSNVELKDLSTGNDWTSLKQTICAFLNTNGGYVIIGVREKNRQYSFTGIDRNNENKLIDLSTKVFQDDNGFRPDLSSNIFFDYYPFMNGEVAIINVDALSEDRKFVKFNDKYYDRKGTGDFEISFSRLRAKIEEKEEYENAKELSIVNGAEIQDLSLDKINQLITSLNKSSRKETLKPTLNKAKQFLEQRHFIRDNKVTTLGMLVCGEDPFRFIEYRAEVDCYYDSSSSISKDKKDFQNDVLSLMDDARHFIWGHIKTGRVIENGGKAVPEYPEDLVREMINNSLAHRDYTVNKFVTIKIEPGKYLQIINPGSFKERIKITHVDTDIIIRRLKPGIHESKNPKLVSILKAYDKVEGQGRGMSTLVEAALANNIDIPYYELFDDASIALTIPSGKLLDEKVESWLNSFERYIFLKLKDSLTTEHKIILAYFKKSELLNKRRLYTILLSESNNHFVVIDKLKDAGLIFEHPNSTESTPLYILDRELMKEDFRDELTGIYGERFSQYTTRVRNVLNILYRHSKYNKKATKPATITPELYFQENNNDINPKSFESLGRAVRDICLKLSKENLLLKNGEGYLINFDFSKSNSLEL